MSAPEVMTELGMENGYIYLNGSDISSINYIPDSRLGYLYYGEHKPLSETEHTESYCIYFSKGLEPKEIHIFKAKYLSDADILMRMLESRARLLRQKQINPHNSDFLTTTGIECKVFKKGRYVFLLAGDTEKEFKHIENLF